MLIRAASDIAPSEITSPSLYKTRRKFLQDLTGLAAAGLLGCVANSASANEAGGKKLPVAGRNPFSTDEKQTAYNAITTYGNFYEFGPNKDDPGRLAPKLLRTRPWTVSVEGEVRKPRSFAIDDILKMAPLEERVFRHRCVEGWSMVIPWVGFPLSEFIKRCDITGNAKFVEFYTLADPEQMPYVRVPFLDWPYMESIRLDEALNPLATLAVGLYGEVMPNQNGAPVRLVVPWKYGFKGAKSIVRVRFVARQPETIWTKAAGGEYGYYANVNPEVDHPRWSQSSERRIGDFFKRKTLMFNGYAEQVAHLYAGMDLRKNF
jgi:methionine sulfoxide reductase catalytic subunit